MAGESRPNPPLLLLILVVAAAGTLVVMNFRDEGSPEAGRAGGFKDVTDAAGIRFRMGFLPDEQGETFKINLYDHGCGVVVGDYDGDGHDDLYFLNQLGSNALYRNKGDGTFEDTTARAGVGLEDRICVAGTFSDYDNDGDQDLYVTSTRGGNVLFQNQGNGTFKDVTKAAGVELVAHSQTAAFFDGDGDGDLDLLVTNTGQWTTQEFDRQASYFVGPSDLWALVGSPKEFNSYYRNEGNGTFSDISIESGLAGQGWGGDIAAADHDADGDIDVFVTNMFGQSQLYQNDGRGVFRDVTGATLGPTAWGAIGSKFFDSDNDGRLDLYVVDMHSDMWMSSDSSPDFIEERKKYRYFFGRHAEEEESSSVDRGHLKNESRMADVLQIQYQNVKFGNTFFRNRGNGTFEETSDAAGLETFWPWGIATGDFDADGHVDVFLPSGMGYPWFYWRSSLLVNDRDGTFTDRSTETGIEPPAVGRTSEPIAGRVANRSSRCAATSDFDGDGRLDLVVNNFNAAPYLYRNEFGQRNWIAFRLRGTRSNRDAIGARVTLRFGNEVMVRHVEAAGGYLSQSSKVLHFGLGDRPSVDRAVVTWPGGGKQEIVAPALNRRHDVVEPSSN